jgi:hypothetical protein
MSRGLVILGLLPLLSAVSTAQGVITKDATVSTDRATASTSVASPAFSTISGGELLLAFISTDYLSGANTTVSSVAGAGLTWTLVVRSNGQSGTSEIWRAFTPAPLSAAVVTATLSQSVVSSLTLITFRGADTSGTNGAGAIGATVANSAATGAPSAILVTTRSNSWVFGVGNDFDNAIGRTPGTGQSLVHQDLAPVGDTYWVQQQTSPTPLSGTSVIINDIAPIGDRFNLAIVEILASPSTTPDLTITKTHSGNFVQGQAGASYTITVSNTGGGATTGTVTLTDALPAGLTATAIGGTGWNCALATLTCTRSDALAGGAGYPAVTLTVSVAANAPSSVTNTAAVSGGGESNTANDTASDVTTINAVGATWSISGAVTPVSLGVGTLLTLTLNGTTVATTTADAAANYSFTGLASGTYTVTPGKAGFTFSPASRTVTLPINGLNATGIDFTATAVQTWSISGTINPASSGSGAVMILSGPSSGYAIANASGNYSFSGLPGGTYTVTPTRTGVTFSPTNVTVPVSGATTNINFTATANPPLPLNYPDLSDLIPPAQISIVGTGSARQLQYTHDTLNGGTGPLEILPVYNPASGNYQGFQHIYSLSSDTWTVSQSIPVAAAFVFDVSHGHFHFPFAGYGLYTSNPDGSIGALVAASAKVGFCIDNSFVYDTLLPNAGFGSFGSCSDPTTLRGLSIAAVDEYDQTDEGQSISIANLPDGTYWLRAVVDPQNFLAESDKSNNETDVQLAITGNTVQVLQLLKPVLPPPPNITQTSPAAGAVLSGVAQLSASPSVSGAVQFLVDGLPFGAAVAGPPYTLSWNTTTAVDGAHWLAAQVTDAAGHIGTSPVVSVTVNNSSTTPPTVQITAPAAGSTVSAVITVAATAAAQNGVPSVQFYVDAVPLGTPVLAPPYMISWNTQTVADGAHVITATATDSAALTGNSAPVSVTVDNSHPPNPIGKDVTVFVDGQGTMTTPSFSTTKQADLLVAFVGYDGPPNSAQTATVSGAGLTWTLLKRSNSQAGTAEIWAASAPSLLSAGTVISQPGVGGYHGSLTVIAFTNAAGPGIVNQASASSGEPDVFIPGASAGNWVFAVGNDWDNAVARIPVSGQVLVHQRLDKQTGDTYWVQSTTAPLTANGLVDIHDTSPTNDRWNYAAVEVVATRQ